jgi:hypothetical protein
MSLFAWNDANEDDWTLEQKVAAQQELLGASLEAHPLELVATKLTDQVFSALDVEGTLSDALGALGERAAVLAGPLTNAIQGFVQEQVLKVVESDAFKTFWVEANRFVHTQVLAILRGRAGTRSRWQRARCS